MEDSLSVSLFLLALATGNHISELNAFLRLDDFITFSLEGVTLYPNPNFLAKNECPSVRRDPIFISCLGGEEGRPHPLCPVDNLRRFLLLSRDTKSSKLFVHPKSLGDLSIAKLRWYLCRCIRWADPSSFPKAHDLRKIATSFAFFRNMSTSEICNLVGWQSVGVFKKHYLKQISEISSPVVVLGSKLSGSVKD